MIFCVITIHRNTEWEITILANPKAVATSFTVYVLGIFDPDYSKYLTETSATDLFSADLNNIKQLLIQSDACQQVSFDVTPGIL